MKMPFKIAPSARRTSSSFAEVASQNLAALSREVVRILMPSGLNVTDVTASA